MKKIAYILVMCLGVWCAGCSENGDDGYYDDFNRVYFPVDSLNYAFGDKPVEMAKYTVKVPVQILGEPARADMKVNVKVDLASTTATAEAYTAVPSEITIPKDSIVGYVPVEIIRENVMDERDTVFRVVFQLEASPDFALGVKEGLRATVTFSNYLAEPEWWVGLKDVFWGPYQKEKYQKMMEIWGGPITLDDYVYKMVKLINVAKEMYEYFQEHPEYGMEFPPYIFWPYE